jgi:2-iminobutanoate/2-iminopropanoate deaminase
MMTESSKVRSGRSIEIEGITHGHAPIPMGARVGNMVYSSGIMGKNPATDTLPSDAPSQSKFMFANLQSLLSNAGATLKHVVHVKAYIKDNTYRDALNEEWLKCFPDPHDRPARHTMVSDLPGGMLMQIEIVAVVTD